MKRKKKARRKKQHFAVGSVMNVDRRQYPERRAFEVQGNFETCVACGTQKARGLMCPICFGRK